MHEPTEDEVIELLRDPACPSGRGLRIEEEVVPVAPFIAFARSRGLATSRVEKLADTCVARLGGERKRVVDPWSWLPNLIRRATGNLPSAPEDVWLLPSARRPAGDEGAQV